MFSKIKYFFDYIFFLKNLKSDDILFPYNGNFVEVNKSLIGNSYYYNFGKNNNEWKIISPIKGVVLSCHNNCVELRNENGLQVLISLNVKENSFFPLKKIFDCKVFKGKKIKKRDEIFTIHLNSEMDNLAFYIPWQPDIIKRIIFLKNKKRSIFLKIYYRKKKGKLNFGRSGEYL